MAFIADGLRYCDRTRVALAAVNTGITLGWPLPNVILCLGIWGNDAVNDRFRTTGTFTIHWRRAGGIFAAITDTTEIRIASSSGTVLSHGTSVTATTARCSQTATFIAGGQEVQGVASSVTSPSIQTMGGQGGEWQIGLDLTNAVANQAYEFRAIVVQDAGTNTIDYTGQLTVPAVPTLEQEGFRWRNDDGTEATATWAAVQDTGLTVPSGQTKRLRVLVNTTGDSASTQYQLEYRKVGETDWSPLG